jgi:hypothetical protein
MIPEERCPRCGTEMVPRMEALRVNGAYVGHFDAMSCPICSYYYFTEKGVDLGLKAAREIGVVGPSFPYLMNNLASEEIDFGKTESSGAISGELTMKDTIRNRNSTMAEQPKIDLERLILVPAEITAGE